MFIKLKLKSQGAKVVYINTDHIEAFSLVNNHTYVATRDQDAHYDVQETPEEIVRMIKATESDKRYDTMEALKDILQQVTIYTQTS